MADTSQTSCHLSVERALIFMPALVLVFVQIVTRKQGFDDSLISANASAEEASEFTEDATTSGVDIVLNHSLQETGFDKKGYLAYMKDYSKA